MAFEDKPLDIQVDLVSLALEYVNNNVEGIERIFIHGVMENFSTIHFGYQIGEQCVDVNFVNSVLPMSRKIATSDEIIVGLLDLGLDDLKNIVQLCKSYQKDHPTELWMIYDTQNQSFKTKYSYDWRYDKDETLELNSREEFEAWLEELSKGQGDW